MSCGLGCRQSLDPVWLWRRPAATAVIQPLAWELPYAASMALKKKKKKRKKKKELGKPDVYRHALRDVQFSV